eukprot:scaffold85724_cov50-Attheya_sp.AAC.1
MSDYIKWIRGQKESRLTAKESGTSWVPDWLPPVRVTDNDHVVVDYDYLADVIMTHRLRTCEGLDLDWVSYVFGEDRGERKSIARSLRCQDTACCDFLHDVLLYIAQFRLAFTSLNIASRESWCKCTSSKYLPVIVRPLSSTTKARFIVDLALLPLYFPAKAATL